MMTSEQGIAIGLVVIIGYIGWLEASIVLYRANKNIEKLKNKIKTLEGE